MTGTLADFLCARIAEDEEQARLATVGVMTPNGLVAWNESDGSRVLVMAMNRMLAECEAKRQVVYIHRLYPPELTDGPPMCSECPPELDPWPCQTLRALGTVYADHPDYRPEWSPFQ